MDLGPIGVWSFALRGGDRAQILETAAELEQLGYTAIWFPGGQREGMAEHIEAVLGATKRIAVATGIVSIWTNPAETVGAETAAIEAKYPGRYLLGLGVSHSMVVERSRLTYEKPL